ncbi:hypothetical protein [Humibacter ginsengisoli]
MTTVEAIALGAGEVRAVVVPALGGRVLSFSHRGVNLFWRNPDLIDGNLNLLVEQADPLSLGDFSSWQNWGGDKSWVAPQGWDGDDEWHGPPDRVFDAGAFDVIARSGNGIGMRSAFDPRTGLRMTRTVTVTSLGMHVKTSLRNESERARRWAAWEVAQLPVHEADLASPHAGVYVRCHQGSGAIPLFSLHGTLKAHADDGVMRMPFARAIGKLGFPSACGEIEVRRAEAPGLRMTFHVNRYEAYPDDSPAQVWMQTPLDEPLEALRGFASTAAVVEIEATSPLRRLEPGASVALDCDWTVMPSA